MGINQDFRCMSIQTGCCTEISPLKKGVGPLLIIIMKKLKSLWQKDKISVLFVTAFSICYILIGCLWFLAPDNKFYPDHPGSYIESVVPILGWAIFFLKFPLYTFVPILAVAGGFTGLLARILLTLKWPVKVIGIIFWLLLMYVNYYIGLFLYIFAIMIW
jgi:hypothetical protein